MPEPVQVRNPWLCVIIVSALSFSGVLGISGYFVLGVLGKPIPEALVGVIGMCIGSLASFLVHPPPNSVGIRDSSEKTLP